MSTLAELQDSFARALSGDTAGAESWVCSGGVAAVKRLAIYQHNVDALLANYLRAAFPAVARLGGEDYFVGLAHAYRVAHPSRSGDLQRVGAAFPAFLAGQLQDSPYAFMADVARLEWAYQEALVAADARVFDVAAFSAVAADQLDALVFALAPSVRCVQSAYPTQAIWMANRVAGRDTGATLDDGGECLLLHRVGDEVHVRRLDPGAAAFVGALVAAASLADCIVALEAVDAAADPTALLLRLIQWGVIDGLVGV